MCVYRLVCMIGAVKRRVYGQVSVHAISKASSMIGDMTCLIYPTQLVAEGIMFLTRPSSLSVSLSCFSCQRNSSETAQQNFIKICSYKEHNVHRKF